MKVFDNATTTQPGCLDMYDYLIMVYVCAMQEKFDVASILSIIIISIS